jgi:hypothetical protein
MGVVSGEVSGTWLKVCVTTYDNRLSDNINNMQDCCKYLNTTRLQQIDNFPFFWIEREILWVFEKINLEKLVTRLVVSKKFYELKKKS